MKRRNDVEKTMEPMFPRLHVNDNMKGGPRAPPRNKMALYEQLTIPSQRFNPRGLPPNSLPTSSIQANGIGAKDSSNLSLTDDHLDDKSHSHYEKQGDEDDCSVPIYVQSWSRRELKRGEKTTSAGSKSSSGVAQDGQTDGHRRNYSLDMNSKEDVISPSEDKSKDQELEDDVCVKDISREDKIVKTDVCEILMVDSTSRSDVSPDDVVGVMGQRRFWKARETIAKHQRVFAFQLFELHRLIKVQQLMADSPQLCAEDSFFIANSTIKVSPPSKHPSKCIAKASKKIIDRKQCSADNAMSITSIPLARNSEHFGTARPVPLASERNMTSWWFSQPINHRWLIPVMSPSEGLVYKPCPEGYVPYGSMPMMGGFANPTQENDVFPTKTPTEHHYNRPRTISDSVGDQSSSCGHGSKCQKSSFVPSDASRGTELQARSRRHYSDRDQSTEERDGAHVHVDEDVTHGNRQTSQVIKVVPRNPRSAGESAARIFQSIQEERKLKSKD